MTDTAPNKIQPMATDAVRWAIVGTGFISRTMAEAVIASPGSTIEMVIGRNPETLAEFSSSYDIPNAATELSTALESDSVDAIYIGLPNHVHHEFALAATAAGKPTLSEKSLTRDMASAEQLVDGLGANGTLFVEGLMYLAHPLYRKVMELLVDGRLGELRAVSGFYSADIAAVANPAGGGTLYNLACYPASLLHLTVQTMCGAEAFASRDLRAVGTKDSDGNVAETAASIRFGNGVLATLQSSDTRDMSYGFEIVGTKGTLRWVTNPWLPVAGNNLLEWRRHNQEPELISVSDPMDSFGHQVEMMESLIANKRIEADRPSPRWQDSLEIMSLLTDWEAAV